MHINGENLKTCVGINMVWSQLENALFQTGVSIFVIISGYFQIKTTFCKLAKIEITVICYSVISSTIWYFVKGGSFLSVVKAFIPISTEKYWFMTAYVILAIVAIRDNRVLIIDKLIVCECLTKLSRGDLDYF